MIFVVGLVIGYIIGEIFGFLKSLVGNKREMFDRLKDSHTELVQYLSNETKRKLRKYKVSEKLNDQEVIEFLSEISKDIEKYTNEYILHRYKFYDEALLEFFEDCYINGKDQKYINAARKYVSGLIRN